MNGSDSRPLDDYERPQQTWHCGLADEGPPCPMGPTAHGHCPAAAACHPVRDGDRWRCNRSALRGGPCEHGPGHDGQCTIVYRCTPVRSLRSRRGWMVGAAAATAVGLLGMMLSGPWREAWIAPGPLSRAHAQLLAKGSGQGCAACHAPVGGIFSGQDGPATRLEGGSSQSTRCWKCHGGAAERELALRAHVGLEGARGGVQLAVQDGETRRRDSAESIACSACHQEHRGADHDLTQISDAACQACHRQRFHSFATDHPDFGSWPYETPTRIAFNHRAHQQKHFPEVKADFACAACHAEDSATGAQTTAGYEAACSRCHDKALVVSLADGSPIVSLPTLDVEALAEAGHDVGSWPDAASGDFEGSLPAAPRMLIASDPVVAAALTTLGPQFDFFDLDVADDKQTAAAATAVAALKKLVGDLAEKGGAAIDERLSAVLGRKLTDEELRSLSGGLSSNIGRAYHDRWFAATGVTEAKKIASQSTQGQWFLDDPRLALKYRAVGHADPFATAWLDMLAETASGPRSQIAAPLLEAAMKPTAPGQCGSCHTIRVFDDGRMAIQWRAAKSAGDMLSLTRFNHGPHLLQPQLRDCSVCHQLATANVAAETATTASDFSSMSKRLCAECHKPDAAGDHCTQCHRYHGSGPVEAGRRP